MGSSLFDQYTHRSWTERDGLPPGRVRAIAQDRDGYLWIGTEVGLIRFDGVRFVPMQLRRETTAQDDRVLTVINAADGSIWTGFGAGGGVSRLAGDAVTNYGSAEGLGDGFISGIAQDPEGSIWAAAREGLYRFRGDHWTKASASDGVPPGPAYGVYVDAAGNLWAALATGVICRNRRESTFHLVDGSHHSEPTKFAEGPGWLVVADETTGIRVVSGSIENTGLANFHAPVTHALRSRDGVLWIATNGYGLASIRPMSHHVENFTAAQALTSDAVRVLFEDREGNVWVGTQSGLDEFSRRIALPITNLGVTSVVAAGSDGRMWVGTAQGVIGIDAGTQRRPIVRIAAPGGMVSALHVASDGQLSIATRDLVFRLRGTGLVAVGASSNDGPAQIASITTDLRNTIWIGDVAHGLFRWTDGHLAQVYADQEEPPRPVFVTFTDSQNRVWVGSSQGRIGRFDVDGGLQWYGPADGLTQGIITSLYEDERKTMWIGSSDGLTRFADGRFQSLTYGHGFPMKNVSAIVTDGTGSLWLGVSTGIVHLNPAEFAQALADPHHPIEYELYDSSDGLAGAPGWQGTPTVARALDGRLWFVTGNGLTVIDPHALREKSTPPIRIESLTADAKTFTPGQPLKLAASTSRIQIDYTALTLTSPLKVRFRYKLDGFDADWVDAVRQRQAFYTNLPPGQYRFKVMAVGDDVDAHHALDYVDFSIDPAFHQTRWFYGLLAVAILGAGATIWRVRVQSVHRHFLLILEERLRLSREIHDTLLQGLVGVALQLGALPDDQYVSPSDAANIRHARRQVEEYIREARQSILNLRSPTAETPDIVSTLTEIGERLTKNTSTRFALDVVGAPSPNRPPQIDGQLLRIGQEAVTNAVRHGAPTRVDLQVDFQADSVRLAVSDDGCGFDVEQLFANPGPHCGLLIMQERAEQVGGRLSVRSAPGAGTVVEVIVPTAKGAAARG